MFSRSILTDGELGALIGLHSGPKSRTHQAGSGKEHSEVGGRPADWAQHPGHLTLIGAEEDAR